MWDIQRNFQRELPRDDIMESSIIDLQDSDMEEDADDDDNVSYSFD